MPEISLASEEIERVLSESQLVRVAFVADVPYVLAFGYACLDGYLVGTTGPGHNVAWAAQDSRVGFQVDTSLTNNIYEWESVRGEGRIAITEPESEILHALRKAFPNPPEWFIADRMKNVAEGRAMTFRIEPMNLTGVRSGR